LDTECQRRKVATAEDDLPSEAASAWLFFRSLKSSQLLSSEDVDLLERRANEEPLEKIQGLLLETGLLNDYQLTRLKKGEVDGLVFGQYRILGELSRGGCGQVFKARHALMDRVVVLKVISPDLVRSQCARDVFLREVIACTRLSHPHIATAYDADEREGQLFFVMEYVDGTTLHSYVQAGGPIPIPLACSILLESALALQHAHEKGLVHRDIKPANILLYAGPLSEGSKSITLHVKIVDFGLARIAQINSELLKTIPCHEGGFLGTPAFIAPEQIKDSHKADIRSDLYSLGCAMYYALAGQQPFDGINTEATLYLHLEEEPAPLQYYRPLIPPAMARVVHRLMAKNPAQRYQTPAELIDALNGLILSGEMRDPDSMAVVNEPRIVPRPLQSAGDSALHSSVLEPVVTRTPMPAREASNEPVEDFDVQELWLDWIAVVEDLSQGMAPEISERQYKALYRKLLSGIRQARLRGQPLSPALCDRLQNLVEPWVVLVSLANLEPRLLGDLWQDCRAATHRAWPERASAAKSSTIGVTLLAAIGLLIAALCWLKLR
jgi:serine/threonine protein kinase